jgi:hypothetical protein
MSGKNRLIRSSRCVFSEYVGATGRSAGWVDAIRGSSSAPLRASRVLKKAGLNSVSAARDAGDAPATPTPLGSPGAILDVHRRGMRHSSSLREGARSGHFPRVFAGRWLRLEPGAGRYFFLGTASLCAVGYEHDPFDRVIRLWDEMPREQGLSPALVRGSGEKARR